MISRRLCCINGPPRFISGIQLDGLCMSRPRTLSDKTLKWTEYNKALKRRASLADWFNLDLTCAATPTDKRGRPPVYSAIQTCLTVKALFGMPLRQNTGFVECWLHLTWVDWTVPNFRALSRRTNPSWMRVMA